MPVSIDYTYPSERPVVARIADDLGDDVTVTVAGDGAVHVEQGYKVIFGSIDLFEAIVQAARKMRGDDTAAPDKLGDIDPTAVVASLPYCSLVPLAQACIARLDARDTARVIGDITSEADVDKMGVILSEIGARWAKVK